MYAWIWRHLPFRHAGLKTLSSLILAVGVGALLWYVIFPKVDPWLPFNDGQIEGTTNNTGVPASPSKGASTLPTVSPTPTTAVEMPR